MTDITILIVLSDSYLSSFDQEREKNGKILSGEN